MEGFSAQCLVCKVYASRVKLVNSSITSAFSLLPESPLERLCRLVLPLLLRFALPRFYGLAGEEAYFLLGLRLRFPSVGVYKLDYSPYCTGTSSSSSSLSYSDNSLGVAGV